MFTIIKMHFKEGTPCEIMIFMECKEYNSKLRGKRRSRGRTAQLSENACA